MARQSNGTSTLSRHLAILNAFDADAAFLTISQISRRASLPISSVHRLSAELQSHGLLERLDDRTFRLGIRLWELAARTPGALGLREIALPFMQEVHAVVRQHTQLAVLHERQALFLERLSMRDAVINVTLVGGRLPLHASVSGLILLAHSPLEMQDAVLNYPLERFTNATIHDAGQLRNQLGQIRRDGFAVGDGYIHPESRGIGVPVNGPAGPAVAALSVIVPNDNTPISSTVMLLRNAADEISRALRAAYLPVGEPDAEPGGSYRPLVHSSARSMQYLAATRRRKFP